MIRKIKTDVNGEYSRSNDRDNNNSNNNSQSYDIDNKNAKVEELNLDSYSSNNTMINTGVVTEETVLNAINERFNINRDATNNMNKEIYKTFMEKISNLVSSNGGDI